MGPEVAPGGASASASKPPPSSPEPDAVSAGGAPAKPSEGSAVPFPEAVSGFRYREVAQMAPKCTAYEETLDVDLERKTMHVEACGAKSDGLDVRDLALTEEDAKALRDALQKLRPSAVSPAKCEVYDGTLRELRLDGAEAPIQVGYEWNCSVPALGLRVERPEYLALREALYRLAGLDATMRPT